VDLGLRGKSALLTGASRGLAAPARFALAREGVDVTILARTKETLERHLHRKSAPATGVAATPVAGDVTTPDGRAAALAACPNPDILINNAEGPLPGDFRDWTRDDWIAALDTMMLAHIEMMRATVDDMLARGFGRIVTSCRAKREDAAALSLDCRTGARSGLAGFAGGLARQNRRAQRHGQQSFAGHLRQRRAEAPHRGHAGFIRQNLRSNLARARRPPTRPSATAIPDELGAYCAFLCSIHAGYITGQNLVIDGGSYPGAF